MQIHYLEIVTPDVDAVCTTYEQLHGVSFSEPDPGLGNARTAALLDGGKISFTSTWARPSIASTKPILLATPQRSAENQRHRPKSQTVNVLRSRG